MREANHPTWRFPWVGSNQVQSSTSPHETVMSGPAKMKRSGVVLRYGLNITNANAKNTPTVVAKKERRHG